MSPPASATSSQEAEVPLVFYLRGWNGNGKSTIKKVIKRKLLYFNIQSGTIGVAFTHQPHVLWPSTLRLWTLQGHGEKLIRICFPEVELSVWQSEMSNECCMNQRICVDDHSLLVRLGDLWGPSGRRRNGKLVGLTGRGTEGIWTDVSEENLWLHFYEKMRMKLSLIHISEPTRLSW